MMTLVQRLSTISVLTIFGLASLTATRGLAQQADVTSLLQTAASGEGQARYAAIDQLGEYHEAADAAVPELVKLLEDSDPMVRWRSARSPGRLRGRGQSCRPRVAGAAPRQGPRRPVPRGGGAGEGRRRVRRHDRCPCRGDHQSRRAVWPGRPFWRFAISIPTRTGVMAVFEKVLASDDRAVVAHAIAGGGRARGEGGAGAERGAEAAEDRLRRLCGHRTDWTGCGRHRAGAHGAARPDEALAFADSRPLGAGEHWLGGAIGQSADHRPVGPSDRRNGPGGCRVRTGLHRRH